MGYLGRLFTITRASTKAAQRAQRRTHRSVGVPRWRDRATLLTHGYEAAKEMAKQYADCFAPGDFYLEVQPNGLADQAKVNEDWKRMSAETGIPLVATGDCHYVHQTDAKAHEVLMAIQQGDARRRKTAQARGVFLLLAQSGGIQFLFRGHAASAGKHGADCECLSRRAVARKTDAAALSGSGRIRHSDLLPAGRGRGLEKRFPNFSALGKKFDRISTARSFSAKLTSSSRWISPVTS